MQSTQSALLTWRNPPEQRSCHSELDIAPVRLVARCLQRRQGHRDILKLRRLELRSRADTKRTERETTVLPAIALYSAVLTWCLVQGNFQLLVGTNKRIPPNLTSSVPRSNVCSV